MIKNHDRSLWIGASDTSYVMGNWQSDTFTHWWLQKLGINKDHFSTEAMKVGTAFEHKILDTIPDITMDAQILIPEKRLRVNYDGTGDNHIYEVKTHKNAFKLNKGYWQQAQVEMYAWLLQYGVVPALDVVSYQVDEDDYKNFFNKIDPKRLEYHKVVYDKVFIEEYEQKLLRLKECIDKGIMP